MVLSILKNYTQKSLRTIAASALALSLLAGCATEDKNEFAGWSVEKLYNEGRDQMIAGDYTRAALLYEATAAQYPFSAQATQAQLELPYVYWKDESRLKALGAADRFIALNGSHPQLDYMYYLKGIINVQNNINYFKALLTREAGGANDPKAASEAFDSFKTVVDRYPSSRYAPDSRKRMIELVDTMAQQETKVARYYYEHDAYLAAINRAQGVLKNFDGTPSVETALIIMAKSYDGLKMNDMRDDTLKVLYKNFPNSTGKLGKEDAAPKKPEAPVLIEAPKAQ